jgi:hypothetical protein
MIAVLISIQMIFSKPVYNPYAGQNVQTKFGAYFVSTGVSMPFEVLNEIVEGRFV